MSSFRRKSVSALVALGIGALVWPSVASADVYVQTSDHCTGGCTINANNTITVTQSNGVTTFDVSLASGWSFVDTGANGSGGALNFGFGSALTNLTVTNTTSPTTNGWTTTNGEFFVQGGATGSTTATVNTALIQAPAANGNKFKFTNGIAIGCNSTGSSTACSTPLSFTINTVASLVGDSTAGSTFWADVISSNGNTGLIDFTLRTSQVPLPPAAVLFGTALVGMGILGRRRSRKHKLAQA